MKTLSHDGFTFEVIDKGAKQGTPIILLHGFPQHAQSWDRVAHTLAAEGYRCIAPSQRGYSVKARPKDKKTYRAKHLVADIMALLDDLQADKVHLVGHDWGGVVAWLIADRAPHRLASLTIVSMPHPRAYMRALYTSRQFLFSWYIFFFQLPRVPELFLESYGKNAGMFKYTAANKNVQLKRYIRQLAQDRSSLTAALNWYRALRFGITNYLPGDIKVPTLYVWSTGDNALSRRAAELTKQWIRAPYTFRIMGGVSHWIPEEEPTKLAELILKHAHEYPAK